MLKFYGGAVMKYAKFVLFIFALAHADYTYSQDIIQTRSSKYNTDRYTVVIMEPNGLPIGCSARSVDGGKFISFSLFQSGNGTISVQTSDFGIKPNKKSIFNNSKVETSDFNFEIGKNNEEKRGWIVGQIVTFNIGQKDFVAPSVGNIYINGIQVETSVVEKLINLTRKCLATEAK